MTAAGTLTLPAASCRAADSQVRACLSVLRIVDARLGHGDADQRAADCTDTGADQRAAARGERRAGNGARRTHGGADDGADHRATDRIEQRIGWQAGGRVDRTLRVIGLIVDIGRRPLVAVMIGVMAVVVPGVVRFGGVGRGRQQRTGDGYGGENGSYLTPAAVS